MSGVSIRYMKKIEGRDCFPQPRHQGGTPMDMEGDIHGGPRHMEANTWK